MARQSLAEYKRKRDFTRTPEPAGGRSDDSATKRRIAKKLSYCVQHHWASSEHYDFRLEHHGVLLSWAVPKGPSLNPHDKRLAMQVEDHPVEYGSFEGVIPDGYGAGVVMLWDRGSWEPDEKSHDVEAALAKGDLGFILHGEKLKGAWKLIRTRGRQGGREGRTWLLFKRTDNFASDEAGLHQDRSVKTGGSVADILKKHKADAERLFENLPDRISKLPLDGKGPKLGRSSRKAATHESDNPALVVSPPQPSRPAKSNGDMGNGRHGHSAQASTAAGPTQMTVRVAGKELKFTNLKKVLYPSNGFTKGEVLDYYSKIASFIMPHLKDRPVTLKRYPDGVESQFFYQKRCPEHRPEWLKTVDVPSEREGKIPFCVLDNAAALLWAENLASIELHTYLHRVKDLERPTMIAFDFDPGPPATLGDCARVALLVRDQLAEVKLKAFVKASGGKGIHLYVPLNTAVTYEQTSLFARTLAQLLEQQHPDRIVSNMRKELRQCKVLIDWSQNSRHKTTVCVYSMRARTEPSVSMPLNWEEVEKLAASRKPPTLDTTPATAIARAEKLGDLFAPMLTLKQKLPVV